MRYKFVTLLFLVAVFLPVVASAEDFSPETPQDRLTRALQVQGLSLGDTDKQNLSQKCQGAQQKLSTLRDATDTKVRQRIDDFTVVQKELLAMKLRMARQGVDASEIDLLIGKIQQAIDTFLLSSNTYGSTIDDLLSINCAERPELFKAGLILLRAQNLLLIQSADDMNSIIDKSDELAFNQLSRKLRL